MKRMDFITDKDTNKLIAVVKDDGINGNDGSTIIIKKWVYGEALKEGVFTKVSTIRGNNNFLYDCGDMTFLNIKDDEVTVLDSVINGMKIEHILAKKSVSINRNNNGRGVCRISLPKVRHIATNEKDIVVSNKSYPVSINLILNDIALNKVCNQVKNIKYYDTVDREGHHESACWDNRVSQTIILTTQQHKEHHSKENNSEESHQIICIIDTVEKLKALIEYLRTNR